MLHVVLEAADVRPLTFHLRNRTRKVSKACWVMLEKKGRTQKLRLLHVDTIVCWLTSPEDLTSLMADRDVERERERRER